ncbi:hypothetical protein ACHHYP_01356 [Achlya hypogyna]|uniref:B box-type domain-containing protein n=1 Tax=Achlya hypogyna TaxID=1202772 RepID=A0A1V9ZU33_ACHHY|nr:hypothetical protein ACHHYP_01356 [Achlya hypogyna]
MIGAVAGAGCCRCTSSATVVCVDCELVYCSDCSEMRHRKGSFLRHVVKPVADAPCDECSKSAATLVCAACELSYCDTCSKEVHRDGALQAHVDLGHITRKDAPPPPAPFLSPFSASSNDSPFSQRKRWSMSSDSLGDDTADSEVDLWTGWSVFGEQRLSESSSNQSKWMNPACDGSDDDAKPSSIADAFKDLALTHSSSTAPEEARRGKPRARLVSWESYSQNELEDLFSALTSRTPTRHVAVRSPGGGPFSSTHCANVYQTLHGYGDIAHCLTTMAPHGVLLYTYYEHKSAVQAVADASRSHLALDFCLPFDTPTAKTAASVEITFAPGYDRHVVTMDDLHLVCSTLGDVVDVAGAMGQYVVEFNDARAVPRALALLAEKSNLGGHVFNVQRAPVSPAEHKRLGALQGALRQLAEGRSANPAHSPEKSFALAPAEGIWSEPLPALGLPPAPAPPADEFSLGLDRVYAGTDKRTTLMVRNIPNKYTQSMLLAEINERHMGQYDFFYLPIDFKNKCNMGYAFINFMDTAAIGPFYETFNGQKWPNFNSDKVCAISYARLQGKAAMIARFQNSSLLDKHESYRPLVFKSSGPNRGALEPFPAGKPKAFKPPYPAEPPMPPHVYAYPPPYGYAPYPPRTEYPAKAHVLS